MKKLLRTIFGLNFSASHQMIYAIVMGLALGIIFREKVAFIKIFGDIFIKSIKMTVVPLIFVSIVHVLCTMKDMLKTGKMALKCVVIFTITTGVTAILGILTALIFKPGINSGINPEDFIAKSAHTVASTEFSLAKEILHIFPDNPFASFASGDVLQILVFAVFFGLAINFVRSKAENVIVVIEEISEVVYKLVAMVTKFAPIGVFGLVGYLAATQDLHALLSLAKHLGLFYGAGLFILFVLYPIYLSFFGLNPIHFIKKMFEMQYFAFLTASSTATIPLTKFTAEKKLGTSQETAAFGVPLGATINMNGGALHFGMTSVFLAQIAGVDLTLFHYANIIFLALVLSIGTAGIPSATLVMMPVLLTAIGVPVEYIGIYIGIDRFLDMLRTAINVSGDAMTCVIVDKLENTLDIEQYNSKTYEKFIHD